MIYAVVNEVLGKVTLHNEDAELLLSEAVRTHEFDTLDIHARVTTLFDDIFFEYPRGLQDRSKSKPRDTEKYIDQWRRYASMRKWVTLDDADAEDGKPLTSTQTTRIFNLFKQDLFKNPQPH